MPTPVRSVLRAIAVTIVPEAARFDEGEWLSLERIVADAVATRPPALQRQLRLFLRLIQWSPCLRYGRPFTGLDAGRRTRVLATLENGPLLLVRRGTWGLRTLILMGYYGRPDAAREIGYRATAAGWEARR